MPRGVKLNLKKKSLLSAIALTLTLIAVISSTVSAPMTVEVTPASVTMNAGETAVFNCLVIGNTVYPVMFQWYVNGVLQTGATGSSLHLTEDNPGTYTIYVVATAGVSVQSDNLKLIVKAVATPTPAATATPTPVETSTPTPVETATPTPVATSTPTPVVTATPTPPPSEGLSMTVIYAIVAVVIIIIIIVAAVVLLRKKK